MARLKQVKGWNEYSKELKKAGTRWTIRIKVIIHIFMSGIKTQKKPLAKS